MSRVAFVTLGTHDYAPQIRIFARSVRRFHPEARSILFAVENDAHAELYGDLFDEIVTCPDLGVPALADMAFRYSQAELCFALKPWLLLHLLRRRDHDALFYFDSDIELFSPLTEAVAALRDTDLLLTPHVTVPPRASDHVTDNALLKSGACNAGFLGVSMSPQAEEFLTWWAAKTQADAGHDPERGTYGDQKWLDLAPSLVDKVTILRHPGYNVAYWNAHLRAMTGNATGWFCTGEPLRFFHYSRWTVTAQPPEDYLGSFFPPGCAFLLPLLADYAERVRAEPAAPKDVLSALATFHLPGGEAIPRIVKSAYMHHAKSTADTRDAIVADSLKILNAPSEHWPQHSGQTVTVLFDWLWRQQPEDWRREHDLATAAGRERFKAWLRGGGAAYHAIPSAYLPLEDQQGVEVVKPTGSKATAEESATDSARRDNQMLLARILDLETQLNRYKTSPAPPPKIRPPTADRRLSIWRKGLAFLRGAHPSGQTGESVAYWGEETVFRRFFNRIDHSNVMQIGCGDGEHAAQMLRLYRPRSLALADDSADCMGRFADDSRVRFVHMDELSVIADGSQSAVFSYDHLIRREHDDVGALLLSVGRILAPGKYALLHHSVHDAQPGVAAVDSRGGRAFMSAPLFSHLCARAGLFVIETAKVGELDGLSLVQRVSALN
ncbi:MAG: class I SAM-dependent methyltransferase [Parvibaculaceae bacterium]